MVENSTLDFDGLAQQMRANLDPISGRVQVYDAKTGNPRMVHAVDAREQVKAGSALMMLPEAEPKPVPVPAPVSLGDTNTEGVIRNPFEANVPAVRTHSVGPVTLRGLKINDLRALAKANGFAANGSKAQLKQALVDHNIGTFD